MSELKEAIVTVEPDGRLTVDQKDYEVLEILYKAALIRIRRADTMLATLAEKIEQLAARIKDLEQVAP